MTRNINFYNLDVIISVGYRVNSYQATQFRILTEKSNELARKWKSIISKTRFPARQVDNKIKILQMTFLSENSIIVNAVVHRDYTSNASVQVMMFRDRVEVWNPGSLPLGWTTEKLKKLHHSVPEKPNSRLQNIV